ncbi:hypothetical protein ANCCEY_04840 [Ancylostoma ceylanicum]|uniref:Uncharacterized protein n=2 Tax=Ancylostoma ceylanicum TaxID=53326 RepID=A0A0D6M855_9BILA|nr:hypothetical protein ANCCEY_04840 [Ancylostoma ceylanicum]EYC00401.1 hypothetical protein Y032_0116g606 [Ancylostoma ceylanicum]
MRSSYFLIFLLFAIIQRLHASYPAGIIKEEPAVAIAPAPVIQEVEPASLVESELVAPIPVVESEELVQRPAVVAPTPIVAPAPLPAPMPVMTPAPLVAPSPFFPYAVYSHHHRPRTQVRNTARSYIRETGHTTSTSMAFDAHHIPSTFEYFPRHFYDELLVAAPWRARLYFKKLAAKKAAKVHESFDKNKN